MGVDVNNIERDLFVEQFRKFKMFTQFVEVDDEGAGALFDALKTGELKPPVTPKQQCADEMYEMLDVLVDSSNTEDCYHAIKENREAIKELLAKVRVE